MATDLFPHILAEIHIHHTYNYACPATNSYSIQFIPFIKREVFVQLMSALGNKFVPRVLPTTDYTT